MKLFRASRVFIFTDFTRALRTENRHYSFIYIVTVTSITGWQIKIKYINNLGDQIEQFFSTDTN